MSAKCQKRTLQWPHVGLAQKRACDSAHAIIPSQADPIRLEPPISSFDEWARMNRAKWLFLATLATLAAFFILRADWRAQNVVSSYVTFYGFDDNDDGDPTHLGTDVISHAAVHDSANEDLGTYERPGTLAADVAFLSPGTKVYVPALKRYYVMEDTCRACSEDWLQNKPHIDLYVSGTGPEVAACQERLTMESTKIVIDPPPGLPVRPGSVCGS